MANDDSRKTISSPSEDADTDWKSKLTAEQYEVTRKAGTERAFSGEYVDTKTRGV